MGKHPDVNVENNGYKINTYITYKIKISFPYFLFVVMLIDLENKRK